MSQSPQISQTQTTHLTVQATKHSSHPKIPPYKTGEDIEKVVIHLKTSHGPDLHPCKVAEGPWKCDSPVPIFFVALGRLVCFLRYFMQVGALSSHLGTIRLR